MGREGTDICSQSRAVKVQDGRIWGGLWALRGETCVFRVGVDGKW